MEEVREQLLKTSRVTWMVDTGRIIDSYREIMGSMMGHGPDVFLYGCGSRRNSHL